MKTIRVRAAMAVDESGNYKITGFGHIFEDPPDYDNDIEVDGFVVYNRTLEIQIRETPEIEAEVEK